MDSPFKIEGKCYISSFYAVKSSFLQTNEVLLISENWVDFSILPTYDQRLVEQYLKVWARPPVSELPELHLRYVNS